MNSGGLPAKMDDPGQSQVTDEVSEPGAGSEPQLRGKLIRWAIILGVGFAIALAPIPGGITVASWRLLAIFAATAVYPFGRRSAFCGSGRV